MENNFLLYFFAFAFLIAWSVVVVCSAYSFIRSVKKDIENHYLQINKRGVEYDDKPAYLAIYHIEKNKVSRTTSIIAYHGTLVAKYLPSFRVMPD